MRIIKLFILFFILYGTSEYTSRISTSIADSGIAKASDILYETQSTSKVEGDIQIPVSVNNPSEVKTNSFQNWRRSFVVLPSIFQSDSSHNFYCIRQSLGELRYDFSPYYLVYRNLLI